MPDLAKVSDQERRPDLETLVLQQAEMVRSLQEQLSRLNQRLGPDPDANVGMEMGSALPAIVYMVGHKKGQVDHPGNLAKKVLTQAALDKAVSEGWSLTPHPYVYPDPEAEAAAAAKKAAEKGKK